jgi:hypothetical protein
MPAPPPGEADLRVHAEQFMRAEGYVLVQLGFAIDDRQSATRLALKRLNELRQLDHRTPVVTAYLHEHPKGHPDAVRDLAGSLAKRLDLGARTAADGVRDTFTRVTMGNLDELLQSPLTAAMDARGNRWALGAWAAMNTLTIGRQATSRGLSDRVGDGARVSIAVGQCGWCRDHAGDAVIGQDPLPPYHPSCSCSAYAV